VLRLKRQAEAVLARLEGRAARIQPRLLRRTGAPPARPIPAKSSCAALDQPRGERPEGNQ